MSAKVGVCQLADIQNALICLSFKLSLPAILTRDLNAM
jgi:hypothetical protein